MLPGMTPIVGSGVNPSFEVGGSAIDNANKATYTFTGVAAPSPRLGRRILVAVAARSSQNTNTTGATINGGSTLSAIGNYPLSIQSGYHVLSFFVAEAGAGGAVDVTVSFSTAPARCAITVFSLFGFKDFTTPTATLTTTGAGSASGSINVAKDGAVFGVTFTGFVTGTRQALSTAADTFATAGSVSFSYSASSSAVTWTGLAKASDETITTGVAISTSYNSGLFIALR